MDECLAMICTKENFPYDNKDGELGDKLMPLGDSIVDTVALVNANVVQDDNALILESEYLEVRAQLVAEKTSFSKGVARMVDYPLVDEEERSFVLLETTTKQDRKQEDVLEMVT